MNTGLDLVFIFIVSFRHEEVFTTITKSVHLYNSSMFSESRGRMLNGELYAQRFQKLIYLHLFTECFVKISLQSLWQIHTNTVTVLRDLHETVWKSNANKLISEILVQVFICIRVSEVYCDYICFKVCFIRIVPQSSKCVEFTYMCTSHVQQFLL